MISIANVMLRRPTTTPPLGAPTADSGTEVEAAIPIQDRKRSPREVPGAPLMQPPMLPAGDNSLRDLSAELSRIIGGAQHSRVEELQRARDEEAEMAWATRYDRAVADLRTEYEERYAEGLQLQFSRQAEAEQRLERDAGLWRQKVLHEAARHSEERDEQVAVVLAQRQESLVAMSQRAREHDYEALVAQVF